MKQQEPHLNRDSSNNGSPQLAGLAVVGPLVFASGLCALIYQVVWLRELRLVFGCSTAASSAVLAIFMGGLGFGGVLLGRRVDRHPRPLGFYGGLEFLVGLLAAASPLLLFLVRQLYIQLGGTLTMGLGPGTLLRLVLAALVLGMPTFLMGGTLPAVAKAVVAPTDAGRNNLAWLYGLNTLGAVAGAVAATFLLLEQMGTRGTLWLACSLNLLVGATALAVSLGRRVPVVAAEVEADLARAADADATKVPRSLVFAVAALTGFVFFLMELAWYRTLGPLLGGSTYTFGLILAVALAGIGLGGLLYGLCVRKSRNPLTMLAWTLGIEALLLIAPFALGDRLAVLTLFLAPLSGWGMAGRVLGWACVAGIVILPAAVVSGFQFPLLIRLLGRGGRNLGVDVGYGYAWNTAGAIAGSLAGGFGFLPLFSATGVWRGSGVALALMGLVLAVVGWRLERSPLRATLALAPVLAALLLMPAEGPTAAWRHSGIGAGRTSPVSNDRNQVRDWLHQQRRNILWEAEGIEASVALNRRNGLAFVLNGKIDGNAVIDAPTQVMSGLIGAALHPAPRRSLVVGLGTGSTAGWLARIPTMERVDAVELEPAILKVAEDCGPVNERAMENPAMTVFLADAREFLLTARDRYDLIFSEPSNPFRAGIASMYTREYYEAVKRCLAPGGFFTKWVQAYEVDRRTIDTIYATLHQVFDFVETWQTNDNDLLLICWNGERSLEAGDIRRRLAEEPFRSAMEATWGATDLEGFAARFTAGSAFGRKVASGTRELNTDDLMRVEFGYARTVGSTSLFEASELRAEAFGLGFGEPSWAGRALDRERILRNRMGLYALEGRTIPRRESIELTESLKAMARAVELYLANDWTGCLAAWEQSGLTPEYPLELAMVAESLAFRGDGQARELIARLASHWPVEAAAIRARLAFQAGDHRSASEAVKEAFVGMRTVPWVHLHLRIMQRTMRMAVELADKDLTLAREIYGLLEAPFAVRILDEFRQLTLLEVGARIDIPHAVQVLRAFEPHVPWNEKFLRYRKASYEARGELLAAQAEKDLERFLADQKIGRLAYIPW